MGAGRGRGLLGTDCKHLHQQKVLIMSHQKQSNKGALNEQLNGVTKYILIIHSSSTFPLQQVTKNWRSISSIGTNSDVHVKIQMYQKIN